MIVLKIILGIIIAILLLMCIPVVIYMSFSKDFEAEIRIFFYKKKIYPMAENSEKEAENTQKPKEKKKTANPPKKTKKPKTEGEKKLPEIKFTELIGYGTDLLGTIGKYLKKLLKCFLIYDVHLNMSICGNDAANTAIKTGQYNAYMGGVYATVANVFRLKNISINIYPDFVGEETQINFDGKIKIIPIIAFIIAIRMVLSFLIKMIKILLNTKKQKAVQKNESPN